ncbi:MAG: NAD(P)-binding protein [Syntrophomonadaceae bacterium]|nr:NAD(P)-binding protein [Syntrophomonadaceae bacterium]
MKLVIRELRLPLNYKERQIKAEAARALGVEPAAITDLTWLRQSVDARRSRVCFRFTVMVELADDTVLSPHIMESPAVAPFKEAQPQALVPGSENLPHPPVIVGTGPAGLFCGLLLARQGYRPVLIERGQDIDRRVAAVEAFQRDRVLNENSNVQFGEGGAGSFSDGKLTTRIGDARVGQVLKTLVEHGAPAEILYQKKAHVGTDYIRQAVKAMRQSIISLGGEFHFDSRLTDIDIHRARLRGISINGNRELPCAVLVLAIGHSARDTCRMLEQKGVAMSPKAFAVGLRVEHPQEVIDRLQYGRDAKHPRLPPADYRLTYHEGPGRRSLYTFCMCPGGYVIPCASGAEQTVTNGMSRFARDSGVANSAVLVTVTPADWTGRLGGIGLQEQLEQRAFRLGGGDYSAPAQLMTDFLEHRRSSERGLTQSIATYKPGVVSADLRELFPAEMAGVIERGTRAWEKKMPGWISPQAVFTGVESRSSSPLRMERHAGMCSVSLDGLYPCGEGAGYAGGIVSSAVDGMKAAEAIIRRYALP